MYPTLAAKKRGQDGPPPVKFWILLLFPTQAKEACVGHPVKIGEDFMLRPSKILKMAMASALMFASGAWASSARPVSADLIVYGGTASGVMAAYAAAREGLHVVLLEPGNHLGGMV